ncbi:MAG: tetratricopeptide repeat protein [Proteobacteria bacterium]|nr:tetratricopeptide repeat protein [Pseudomonadota bacterium]MDA1022054.1 tetratricopeptide repeat protein [Pseudomonadota bacterium]
MKKRKKGPAPPTTGVENFDISGELLGEAARDLQAGRAEAALVLIRQVLKSEPDNAEALNLCGVASFHTGDVAEAVSMLETAISFRPGFADALNNLGNVFKAVQNYGDAEGAYKRALGADPDYMSARYNLGIVLELSGRFADAEGCYRECLERDKDFAPGHFNLGNVLKALGRMEEARRAYRRATALQPGFAEALNNLGTVEMELSNPTDAIHAYRQAIGVNPGFADAHYNLGIALQDGGEHEDAIACYEKALSCDPAHAGAQINTGYALKELGRLDDAARAYHKAIATAPDYDKVRVNLGDIYLRQGKPEDALGLCDEFLEIHPGNISVLAFKAIVLEELGQKDGVGELYDYDRLLGPVIVSAPEGFADLSAFNEALCEHVLGHPSLVQAPATHATRFGRHSGELLVDPKGPMEAFEKMVMQAVDGYRGARPPDPGHPYLATRPEKMSLNVWGVAMDSQGHQLAHIHPSAWLSGVYYPRLPSVIGEDGADHRGWIEFGRAPDDFHALKVPDVKLIRPQEGLLILFPSYFYHRTIPFEADNVRISIAFDVLARD